MTAKPWVILADCAVHCKSSDQTTFAFNGEKCYCLDEIPYEELFTSDGCINFYVSGYPISWLCSWKLK